MSNFKAALESDILETFFNEAEFAETAIINGEPMLIIKDDHELEKYNIKAYEEELTRGELLFHVPVVSFHGKKPFRDMQISVGNRPYYVTDISESDGVYRIVLVGYGS
ncbi:hypothetical protein [Jeotgalibacillus terrae]|uniref:DUF2577 domain-containing protein n=1 Tax=Jeotgalibacillus terrae TaxID=587735 RepID=A0ABW5ZGH3_9BACL|nr:hypothetical protein [Jeotgalibacillus terrae]MBM7580013.1 hypothetical protein [Jeotgalibacillus terrae]